MQEAQEIGEKARREDSTSPLHQHQKTYACTKATMNARKELDDHISTLHVGSKIRLYGLLNQTLNGKKGIVLGTANNNRIGIQLQEEQRQVSVRISNIRYWDDLEQSSQIPNTNTSPGVKGERGGGGEAVIRRRTSLPG